MILDSVVTPETNNELDSALKGRFIYIYCAVRNLYIRVYIATTLVFVSNSSLKEDSCH